LFFGVVVRGFFFLGGGDYSRTIHTKNTNFYGRGERYRNMGRDADAIDYIHDNNRGQV
jgi:hypothetical protein